MKKLILLFAALTLSAGLWAQETQNVSYSYPVYNTEGDPASGIKEWKTASVDATVVENASEPVTWNAGWYVVTGTNVTLSKGAVCAGDVHLILADGAKLTATGKDATDYTPGIQVTDNGNSLTIYGQANQTGKLTVTGGYNGAGIGGGRNGSGSNITINGGTVTANGGHDGAGIGGGRNGSGSNITINGGTVTANGGNFAAGIGGGYRVTTGGSGSNITINGGTVIANGGDYGGASIGGGRDGSGSNIKASSLHTIYASNTNPPTTEISHTGNDIASYIAAFRYVIVQDFVTDARKNAINTINAAIDSTDNDNVKAVATNAITIINATTSVDVINAIKEQAIANIASAKAAYNDGKTTGIEEGKSAAFGTLGTKQNGPAVIVTDQDDKQIILYFPKKVQYIKASDK